MSEIYNAQRCERIFTVATGTTALRPALAAKVALMMARGESGAMPYAVAAVATDGEGNLARLIDHFYPGQGHGSTDFGIRADPIADSLAALEVTAASLIAPRVSRLGKVGAGLLLGTEMRRGMWAYEEYTDYKERHGKRLLIRPDKIGKIATAIKGVSLMATVATNDLEPGWKRNAAGVVSVGFAILGTGLGEKTRRGYALKLEHARHLGIQIQ